MEFDECLQEHMTAHAELEPADLIKFCFQAAYGAEHMLSDVASARAYFFREYDETDADDGILFEPLNGEYGRVGFAVWKKMGYDPEMLFDIFIKSVTITAAERTEEEKKDADRHFLEYLSEAGNCVASGKTKTVTKAMWDAALKSYLDLGIRPIHHSGCYREKYFPAYRVVKREMLDRFLRDSEKRADDERQ